MSDEAPQDTPASPEQLDMSMNAKADVQWANPDALTRQQLIRVNALSLAVQERRGQSLIEWMETADVLARFITDGSKGFPFD
jgi:hypothetical protein